MNMLALSYDLGAGVKRDLKKAIFWYKKAAVAGNANAMVFIGTFYRYGHGVPQDIKKAKYWYGRAAARGNSLGKKYLEELQGTLKSVIHH